MKFTTHGLQLAGLDLRPPFQVELCLDPGDDLDAVHVQKSLKQ